MSLVWTCPDCGRSFVNKSQWHACQDTSVDDYLAGKTQLAVSIYEAVVEALESNGTGFYVDPVTGLGDGDSTDVLLKVDV